MTKNRYPQKKAMENLRHTGRNSSEKNLSYAAARTKRRK